MAAFSLQATFSGCWMVGANGYRAEIAIGSSMTVLFGNIIWSGGGVISCNGLTAQYGAGMMVTVGKSARSIAYQTS